MKFSMEGMSEYGREDMYSKIRCEMSRFLLALIKSRQAGSAEHLSHCLFMALGHLDDLEKELRIHPVASSSAGYNVIIKRIGSLKSNISGYISQISEE